MKTAKSSLSNRLIILINIFLMLVFSNSANSNNKTIQDALNIQDFTTVYKEALPLAKDGDAFFQYMIGLLYFYGKGVKKNEQIGIEWLDKAANLGHTDAAFELGKIYGSSEFKEKDEKKSFFYYKLAADSGSDEAQIKVGKMYLSGIGIPKDTTKGIEYLNIADRNGNILAKSLLNVHQHTLEREKKERLLAEQRQREAEARRVASASSGSSSGGGVNCDRVYGNYGLYQYCTTGACSFNEQKLNYFCERVNDESDAAGYLRDNYSGQAGNNLAGFAYTGTMAYNEGISNDAVYSSRDYSSSFAERKRWIIYYLNGYTLK